MLKTFIYNFILFINKIIKINTRDILKSFEFLSKKRGILSGIFGFALGVVAGKNKGSWIDKAVKVYCYAIQSAPSFWVGILVLMVFAVYLKWFPIVGMHTIGDESFGDFMMHFIMPYCVLIIGFLPDLVRYVRSSAITQLNEDYVLVQKAFGSSKLEILFKHVSRNVLLPLITKLGMSLPMLVTGAVITETIFSWPGIGSYFVNAINKSLKIVIAFIFRPSNDKRFLKYKYPDLTYILSIFSFDSTPIVL